MSVKDLELGGAEAVAVALLFARAKEAESRYKAAVAKAAADRGLADGWSFDLSKARFSAQACAGAKEAVDG